MIEIYVVLASIFVLLWVTKFNKSPNPILNIYQRENGLYWLKVLFMYIILSLRKFKKISKDEVKQMNEAMEKPQEFSHHEKAIDAVYFNGADNNGNHLVVGTARRKNQLVDGFLYLKINSLNLSVLETPKLPGTALYQTLEENDSFKVEGIQIIPLEPMKRWKITYTGKLKEFNNRKNEHNVKIYCIWQSNLPNFNFDKDMDALCMAKSMAYEKWSWEYFRVLKGNHQTHYEQFGRMDVTAEIDGVKYDFTLDTLRDHSFGIQREWRTFHRYGLHFLSTENGDRFTVGNVCIPVTFSRLTVGYVYSAEDKKIYPVRDCDLSLYQHGEDGTAPLQYAFSFTAGNKKYTMKVNVVDSPHFYISKDWEVKVVERLCTFEVNGERGWGAAEWVYRNIHEKQVPDFTECSNSSN